MLNDFRSVRLVHPEHRQRPQLASVLVGRIVRIVGPRPFKPESPGSRQAQASPPRRGAPSGRRAEWIASRSSRNGGPLTIRAPNVAIGSNVARFGSNAVKKFDLVVAQRPEEL